MNAEIYECRQGEFLVSTDKTRLDIAVIHGFLKTAYWATNISLPIVEQALENSVCFGLYRQQVQIGFARVITDYATCAYLDDVFVLEAYRGQGLGKWLLNCVRSHPQIAGLRRWVLLTRDAQELYRKFGFTEVPPPASAMLLPNFHAYDVINQNDRAEQ